MIAIALLFVRGLCDSFKSRRRLEAEFVVLRHQLNVLRKRAPSRLYLSCMRRPSCCCRKDCGKRLADVHSTCLLIMFSTPSFAIWIDGRQLAPLQNDDAIAKAATTGDPVSYDRRSRDWGTDADESQARLSYIRARPGDGQRPDTHHPRGMSRSMLN